MYVNDIKKEFTSEDGENRNIQISAEQNCDDETQERKPVCLEGHTSKSVFVQDGLCQIKEEQIDNCLLGNVEDEKEYERSHLPVSNSLHPIKLKEENTSTSLPTISFNNEIKQEKFDDSASETINIKEEEPEKNGLEISSPEVISPEELPAAASSKQKQFCCTECDFQSDFNFQLLQHKQTSHPSSKKKHYCDLCPYETYRSFDMKCHKSKVHIKIEKNISCPHCTRYKTHAEHLLKIHIDYSHSGARSQRCDKCSFSSGRKWHLDAHIKEVHLKLKPFQCGHCSFASFKHLPLQRHLKAVHLKIQPFVCDICDKQFSASTTLRRHLALVHDCMRETLE